MNINIKATNIELTDAIRDYVYSKIEPLEKLITTESEPQVFVEIGRESNHHKKGEDVFMAEIRLNLAGEEYYLKEFNADLYAAIDKVRDEVSRKINKSKGKDKTMFIRGARSLKKRIKGFKPWWPFGKK